MHFHKVAALSAALILATPLLPIAAFAQEVAHAAPDTTVSLPWGDWLSGIIGEVIAGLSTILLGILIWAARLLPASLRSYITDQRIKQVEQLLERAVAYVLNKAAIAAQGREVTFDVHNKLVDDALTYVIVHGPEKLIDWMGGKVAIREKIIARLPIPAAVKP